MQEHIILRENLRKYSKLIPQIYTAIIKYKNKTKNSLWSDVYNTPRLNIGQVGLSSGTNFDDLHGF